MKVLVDTCVWSLALRRDHSNLNAVELVVVQDMKHLIQEYQVQLLGMVRQELLSGIKNPDQFERIRNILRQFRDESLEIEDFEKAAESNNRCRSKGVAMTAVDALLCAVALRRDWSIFSTDPDFKFYSRVLPLKLHSHGRAQ
jgi:hypothetical protein